MDCAKALETLKSQMIPDRITFFTLRYLVNEFGIDIDHPFGRWHFKTEIVGTPCTVYKGGYAQSPDQVKHLLDCACYVCNLDIGYMDIHYEEGEVNLYKRHGYEVAIINK